MRPPSAEEAREATSGREPLAVAVEPPRSLDLKSRAVRPSPRDPSEGRSGIRRWRWVGAVAVAVIVAGALATTARLIGVAAPATELPLNGRLAMLPFTDATVDRTSGWIEIGLMEMVAGVVSRTAGSAVVPPERLRKALQPRGLDLRDPTSREQARGLALASGADQVLDVTVTGERGKGYVMALELFDAGGAVASAQLERENPLAAADALAHSLASGLSSDTAPRRLEAYFSRSPFLDRLYATGVAELHASAPEVARPYFEIALKHRPGFLQAKAQLANCVRQLGELDLAAELTHELILEAQSRGERALESSSVRSLASLEALQGQLEKASELYGQAFATQLDIADRPGQAATLYEMARLALAHGDNARAEELYVEMLGIQQELGDRLGEADTLFQIGSLLLSAGDFEGAEQLLADSHRLAIEAGDVWVEMKVTASLGEIAHRRGELESAAQRWRRALAFYDQNRETPRRLLLSYKLAQVLIRTQNLDEAEEHLLNMLELAAESGDLRYEAQASLGLAWMLLKTGYPKQARTHIDRALELDRWLDDRKLMQSVIAWYAYEQGNYRLAVQTQSAIKRHSSKRWAAHDEAVLRVFREAEILGRRLPMPGEEGYVEPAKS